MSDFNPSVFFQEIVDLGILTEEQVQEIKSTTQSLDDFAFGMRVREWLTDFQIKQIQAGEAKQLVFGSYLLIDHIDRGGMGDVFKAKDTFLKRMAALKLIRQDRLIDEDGQMRFMREAQLAASLTHPRIVSVYGAWKKGDQLYYTMEFVEGRTLSELVAEGGTLDVSDACLYLSQACEGLQYAYEKGIVHRDIKPSNLIITNQNNELKILDFGLAFVPVQKESPHQPITQPQMGMGTVDYMAPEQAMDAHRVDIRADIYGLGCTIYYLLSKKPPFIGTSVSEKLLKHQNEEPVLIENRVRNIPKGLSEVVRKMVAKKPQERYQTPKELAEALKPFIEIRGTSSFHPREIPELNPPSQTPPSAPKLPKPALFAVALILVAVFGGITFFWVKEFFPSPPEINKGTIIVTAFPGDKGIRVRTIREALNLAEPGFHILVEDEAHKEKLHLDEDIPADITIEGKNRKGGLLPWSLPGKDEESQPVIRLINIRHLTIKGFKLDGQGKADHGIEIRGKSPGLTISDCQLQGFNESSILLNGCSGQDVPLVLSKVRVYSDESGTSGITFKDNRDHMYENIEIRDCIFAGKALACVQIANPFRNLKFRNNRFANAKYGFLFRTRNISPRYKLDLKITGNTFYEHDYGIFMESMPFAEKTSKLSLTNNLFVKIEKSAARSEETAVELKGNPYWIVPAGEKPKRVYFRDYMFQQLPITETKVEILCDDDFAVYYNGNFVAVENEGKRYHALCPFLGPRKTGDECLGIICENKTGKTGFLAVVSFQFEGKWRPEMVSGNHCRYTYDDIEDWEILKQCPKNKGWNDVKQIAILPFRVTDSNENYSTKPEKSNLNLSINLPDEPVHFRSLLPTHPQFLEKSGNEMPLVGYYPVKG